MPNYTGKGGWKKGGTGNPTGSKPGQPSARLQRARAAEASPTPVSASPTRTPNLRKELVALKSMIFGHALTKQRLTPLDQEAYAFANTDPSQPPPSADRRLLIALTRLYVESPKDYLDMIVKVLPKDINIDGDMHHHLESWNAVLAFACKNGSTPAQPVMEATIVPMQPQLPILEAVMAPPISMGSSPENEPACAGSTQGTQTKGTT